MIFTEPRFLAFFLAVFGVHWALRSNLVRKAWLTLASLAFYGAWDWRFLCLMMGSTASTIVAWVFIATFALLSVVFGRCAKFAHKSKTTEIRELLSECPEYRKFEQRRAANALRAAQGH